jgi:Flp pilus assembly protein TadD
MKTEFRKWLCILAISICVTGSHAEEISQGVHVRPQKLAVPINEQPYFGFLPKSAGQQVADERLVATALGQGYTRQQAADHSAKAGWQAIMRGDWSTASKRFNQASLFDPSLSQTAHGFAIIVAERDRAPDYAIELFSAAARLKGPLPSLPADHARVLLMNGRPAEAIPLLQKAIKQTPSWEVPHLNLANAYSDLGKTAEACEALKNIPANNNPNVQNDARRIAARAGCQ